MKCATCIWWAEDEESWVSDDHHECHHPAIVLSAEWAYDFPREIHAAVYYCGPAYKGHFTTRPDFGCSLWEKDADAEDAGGAA